MKRKLQSTIAVIICMALSPVAYPQAGTLDGSFDGDGIAMFDLSGGYHETAWDMELLPDTGILLGGTINNGSFSITDGFLLKLNADGSINTSWGTSGLITFSYGMNTYAYDIELLSDGKILVAGTVYYSWTESDFFLARFHADGTPDNSFGANGVFFGSYSSEEDICECMAIQTDGRIVLAGRTYSGSYSQLLFSRVNADGTIDNAFGTSGFTEINSSVQDEVINSVDFLSNGTIVGVGEAYQSSPMYAENVIITKLTPDGTPIPGFGNGGVLVPAWVSGTSSANSVTIKNDSIFIAGYHYGVDADLFLAKHDSSGIAEPSFANNGVSMIDLDIIDNGFDIHLSLDDKIYVSGNTGLAGPGAAKEFLLIRLLGDGTLDPDFNTTGYVTTFIRNDSDAPFAVDIQVDGKIVLGGFTHGLTTSGNNDVAVTRYLNDYIPFGAAFTSDETLICSGGTVNFADQSSSNVISWGWQFEGGTPATSTLENPSVVYSTVGNYDVQLIVSDGVNWDTVLVEDYITVITIPGQPAIPAGIDSLCSGNTAVYTVNSVQDADYYVWQVLPAAAGSVTGDDTTGTFVSADNYSGTFTVKVRAHNSCGAGAWSPELQGMVLATPQAFQITGDGEYCEGGSGAEVGLDGSETGFSYELLLDDVPTGNIVAGNGSALSFGFVTDVGIYSVIGFSDHCSQDMIGQVWVHMVNLPSKPGTPAGPESACNDSSSIYTTTGAPDSDTLIWILSPDDAGTLTPEANEVTVAWSPDFVGTAYLSVQGENTCGTGELSDALEIDVAASPAPQISGDTITCEYFQGVLYAVTENAGNTYAWEIEGGTIESGATTHQISVTWGEAGTGWVRVTEENPEGCHNTTDDYMVLIDECTGMDENLKDQVRIYPNPVQDRLYVELTGEWNEGITIRVMDISGRTLISSNEMRNHDTYEIFADRLKSGVYLIRISGAGFGLVTQKFIKH